MTEPTYISPQLMRDVAGEHESIAQEIDAARARADEVVPAVLTWAPIQYRTKAAVIDVMNRHEQSLREEAIDHRTLADKLRVQATRFEQVDDDNSSRIGDVCADDPACAE